MTAPGGAFSIGFSASSILGLVLVALKLGHVIDWSWWWVTVPFWGVRALFVASIALAMVTGLVAGIFSRQH